MKILQINKYHYIRGGSDSVYFNTSLLLREKGHEVIHFAMEFVENESDENSTFFAKNEDFTKKNTIGKIFSLPAFFYNSDAETRLEKLILREKPDVAHLHIFYGSLTSSILNVLKKNNIPAVVSVHDYKFVCPAYLFLNGKNEICEQCSGSKYYKAVVNNCVKGSRLFSSVFALEAYYRDVFYPLKSVFKRLIFVSKFSAEIHNKYKPELSSITTHLYNFDPVLSSRKQNSAKGKYFLYAGRLSKEKGLITLVKAFSMLKDVSLKIVGNGDEVDNLKEIATENVEFLGFKRGEELQSVISNASFVIVPSEWYENNPMAIIESYSLGKPVVAANIGGIPEIVSEGETGFLFESGDVASLKETIIKCNELTLEEYKLMSDKAVGFSFDNFNPEKHYNSLIKIYEEVTMGQIT